MNSGAYDVLIQRGLVFTGRDEAPTLADIAIRDGRVQSISEAPIPSSAAREVIAADGQWVMPGFIDFHTHYDAEIEVHPELSESVRHGVTTIVMGSCSLGAALGEPEDIADIFCRVEAVPRKFMLPIMNEGKDWNTLTEYFEHLDQLPLGPNVAAYVGHSNLRMHVMGFSRSVDENVRPTKAELKQMTDLLEEGLDAGYLGLSVQTLPWDKLDGDRERSKPLPSYFATWSEFRAFTRILRRRGRIFQGVPNLVKKWNVGLFLLESAGLIRRPLKTTVISIMDIIANRSIYWVVPMFPRLFNKLLGADFRFQALPNPFEVWADGMDLVIFEEFQAGTEAMHLVNMGQRTELIQDPDYRARFKKEWSAMFSPRVYHRNFHHSDIVRCPDEALVGRSFSSLAEERNQHPVDTFLDLVAEHGAELRWHSVIANDRKEPLEYIMKHPDSLIGFSDAGAHLRNMAFYNFPLKMLAQAKMAQSEDRPFMSVQRAVHRLTGEIGDWFGLDVGHIKPGGRADIVVVDPKHLSAAMNGPTEAPIEGFGGFARMVNRNPETVPAVLINGRLAVHKGQPVPELGQSRDFGQLLRATDT